MIEVCDEVCLALCRDQSSGNETLEALWTCLALICNVTVEDHQRNAFLGYLANWSVDPNTGNYNSCKTEMTYFINTANGYAIPINGYISPVLVLLTVINNTLVCIVLLKPHMRSPTNAILIAMALSDMMTGLFPVPVFIYFYATERVNEWIPYNWCYVIYVLEDYIPTIFHTASIWLTMALAIQRYIYVCHSFKARTWCTTRNVIYGTGAIYLIATLSHAPRFFENYHIETRRPSRINHSVQVSACVINWRPWIAAHVNTYFSIYYWFRVIFINLIPCVSLVVMNALLIYAMRVARRRRMQLLRQNKKSESRKLKESNCTTLMLVTVVGLFLLVEFPLGVIMALLIIRETFQILFFAPEVWKVLSLFSNLFILLSYPLNFFIYCGMSKQFRETFKRLFTGDEMPKEREYSQYMTLPTENGKSTAVTGDETAL